MVITCSYPDCSNRLKIKRLRFPARTHPGVVTFHVFPTSSPARLRLWLLALRKDLNTPKHLLKMWRVCSDHFSSDDFTYPGENHVRLKSSAVPLVYLHPAKEIKQEPYQPTEHESDEHQEPESLGAENRLEDAPRSTLQKTAAEKTSGLQEKLHTSMTLILRSPQSSDEHSYYALPRVRFSDEAAEREDAAPERTECSSSTLIKTEEEELPWPERKWIVDESALMKQFRRCQDCGALIREKNVSTSGSLISVLWECARGHEGRWRSSSDARTIPSDCILVSAGTVFPGSTHTHVSEWAAVRNS